jgi:hypothetical protein
LGPAWVSGDRDNVTDSDGSVLLVKLLRITPNNTVIAYDLDFATVLDEVVEYELRRDISICTYSAYTKSGSPT